MRGMTTLAIKQHDIAPAASLVLKNTGYESKKNRDKPNAVEPGFVQIGSNSYGNFFKSNALYFNQRCSNIGDSSKPRPLVSGLHRIPLLHFGMEAEH